MSHKAGQIQSPAGILARISTIPYLKWNLSQVSTRADLIGFRMLSGVPVRSHPFQSGWVHSPGGITIRPLDKKSSPKIAEVKDGLMCRFPPVVYELKRSLTYPKVRFLVIKNQFETQSLTLELPVSATTQGDFMSPLRTVQSVKVVLENQLTSADSWWSFRAADSGDCRTTSWTQFCGEAENCQTY